MRGAGCSAVLAVLVCLSAAGWLAATEKWNVQYLYDQNDSSLVLTDFKFTSAQRGIAAGFVSKRARNLVIGDREIREGVVLVTSDAGKTWTQIMVKEIPNSLFFLDDSIGWMVTDQGVWSTDESGRTWKRIATQHNLERVYFASPTHGFGAGRGPLPLETDDGGKTWKPISIPALPKQSKKSQVMTMFHELAFDHAGNGLVIGEMIDPNADEEFEADWMQPQVSGRNWHDQVGVFVFTHNGGKTWDKFTRGYYGRLSRVVAPTMGEALAIWEFPQFYPWASSLSQMEFGTFWLTRLTGDKERVFTDVLQVSKREAFLAGYQTPGHVHPSPIPGKLRIMRSVNLLDWTDMKVDYRAVARQVWLASAGGGALWAATDTGIILKLDGQPTNR